MIPDSLRRCRVIREPGTTAREGLVRGYIVQHKQAIINPAFHPGYFLICIHVKNLRLPKSSNPIQITKSIVIALGSNLALVDKFAKQSVTIFHADIDANLTRDVRSVSACSPRSTRFSKLLTCLH